MAFGGVQTDVAVWEGGWVVESCWNERGGGLFRVMAELVPFVSSDGRVCCLASTHAETNFCYHVLYEEDITCISIWMCCRCLQLHHGVFVKCLNVCENKCAYMFVKCLHIWLELGTASKVRYVCEYWKLRKPAVKPCLAEVAHCERSESRGVWGAVLPRRTNLRQFPNQFWWPPWSAEEKQWKN